MHTARTISSIFEEIRYDPVAVTAFQLRKVLQTTEDEARQQDAQMLTIRYEDFVVDPGASVEKICAFLELDFSVELQEKVRQTPILDRNRAHPQRDPGFESTVMACFES